MLYTRELYSHAIMQQDVGRTWNVGCTEICGVLPTKSNREKPRVSVIMLIMMVMMTMMMMMMMMMMVMVMMVMVMLVLLDAGDGSGDGMLRIHPLTRSHCPTVTRTFGHSLGFSFIYSFPHSFTHYSFIHSLVHAFSDVDCRPSTYR